IAQLERVAARLAEERAIALEVDRLLAGVQLAPELVLVVERDLLERRLESTELGAELAFTAAKHPPLRATGREALHVETDRLARVTARARGAVQQQTLTTIADVESRLELVACERTYRQAQR